MQGRAHHHREKPQAAVPGMMFVSPAVLFSDLGAALVRCHVVLWNEARGEPSRIRINLRILAGRLNRDARAVRKTLEDMQREQLIALRDPYRGDMIVDVLDPLQALHVARHPSDQLWLPLFQDAEDTLPHRPAGATASIDSEVTAQKVPEFTAQKVPGLEQVLSLFESRKAAMAKEDSSNRPPGHSEVTAQKVPSDRSRSKSSIEKEVRDLDLVPDAAQQAANRQAEEEMVDRIVAATDAGIYRSLARKAARAFLDGWLPWGDVQDVIDITRSNVAAGKPAYHAFKGILKRKFTDHKQTYPETKKRSSR